jgi:hypothetical protein
MRDTIFLVVDRYKVVRMTKRLPDLAKGEIPVKLVLVVEETAFREPVLEREVTVADWRDGLDLADVDFKETFITEAEAEVIRARRLAAMEEALRARGYTVTGPQENQAEAQYESEAAARPF